MLAGTLALLMTLAACAAELTPEAPSVARTPAASPSGATPTEPASTVTPSPVTGVGGSPPPTLPAGEFEVTPVAETDPVPHGGDAADDPAIWVHPTDPSRSIIIGTDKQDGGGLILYDLDGTEVGSRLDGPMNNVDVRGNVVVAGNRETHTLDVYLMDPTARELRPAVERPIEVSFDVYGSCLYQSAADGTLYAFVTEEDDGGIEQWEIVERGSGFEGTLRRELSVGSQAEGCVADDPAGVVYIAEEEVGIWQFEAEPDASGDGTLIATTEDGPLEPDVEGLALAAYADGGGFLVASSQGEDRYDVFDRQDHAHLASFSIEDGDGIDGASNTDGIEITTLALGPSFPAGLVVVHDGNNRDENQNFKLVSLEELLP